MTPHPQIHLVYLSSKIDELRATNGVYDKDASVICLSESHLSKNIDDKNINIDGYMIFRNDRNGRSGGGVAAYVINKLKCIHRNDIETETSSPCGWNLFKKGHPLYYYV